MTGTKLMATISIKFKPKRIKHVDVELQIRKIEINPGERDREMRHLLGFLDTGKMNGSSDGAEVIDESASGQGKYIG